MKLSVVLPVAHYNLKWIERCIISTFSLADELVIVGDGSRQVYDAIDKHYGNVTYLEVFKPGLARALNAGIAAASGDWISFLCSDDWYDLDGAQLVKKAAFNSPESYADIVGGVTQSHGDKQGYWPINGDISKIDKICVITSPALFRKSLWWNVAGYSDVRYLDWHFWKKCIAQGARYRFHNILMYHYQAWPGTISARYGYRSDLGHEWGNGPKER